MYKTKGFKESGARVFLTALPITAKILEVERFTSAQDRFNITSQRSVSKVRSPTPVPFHEVLVCGLMRYICCPGDLEVARAIYMLPWRFGHHIRKYLAHAKLFFRRIMTKGPVKESDEHSSLISEVVC